MFHRLRFDERDDRGKIVPAKSLVTIIRVYDGRLIAGKIRDPDKKFADVKVHETGASITQINIEALVRVPLDFDAEENT